MQNQRVILIGAVLIVLTFAVLGGSLLFRGDPEDEPTEIAPTEDHSAANTILEQMDEDLRAGALAACAEFETETDDSQEYLDCLQQYLEDNRQEEFVPEGDTSATAESEQDVDIDNEGAADTDDATTDE